MDVNDQGFDSGMFARYLFAHHEMAIGHAFQATQGTVIVNIGKDQRRL